MLSRSHNRSSHRAVLVGPPTLPQVHDHKSAASVQLNPGDTPPVVGLQVLANPRRSKRRHQRQRYRSRADVPTNCGSPSGGARIGRSLGSGVSQQKATVLAEEFERSFQRILDARENRCHHRTNGADVVADARAGATSAQCVDRAVEQGSGRLKSIGLYRATEIARIFRQNCSQEFLAGRG